MNHALLVYMPDRGEQNIGDYVQSLAAGQFFPKDQRPIYLNREQLHAYAGDRVKLIMNGWFTHLPDNWPPSADLDPLFVAFHVNTLAESKLMRESGVQYLKSHEPIGCRDRRTVSVLQAKGIQAYFSGCLTLTLGQTFSTPEKDDKIYFVDPYYDWRRTTGKALRGALLLASRPGLVKTLASKLVGNTRPGSLLRATYFYRSYKSLFSDEVLLRSEYIRHMIPESSFRDEDHKFEVARGLLERYARAKLVVTSRIHCALPSLGFGTPVIYTNNTAQSEASHCRLDGLLELFNVADWSETSVMPRFEGCPDRIEWNSKISNKQLHVPLRDALIERCRAFAG